MRPAKREPIRLSDRHCCQCSAAHGSVCGHIASSWLCHQHAQTRVMRDPDMPRWWQIDNTDEYRPPEVCWD